jgi:ribosome-binding factor A
MSSKRVERVNELLRHEIANGLYHIQTTPPLDLARVTVSAVDCAPDLRKAKVKVSVLEDDEIGTNVDSVVRILNRNRNDFQKLIATNVVMKYTPHLQFIADRGQAQADRIFQILDSLPPPSDDNPLDEDAADVSPEG